MPGTRFTSWLGEEERRGLADVARAARVSDNFVLRLALRALLFGEPLPSWLQTAVEERQDGGSKHVEISR